MSIHTVERALYEMASSPAGVEAFKASPAEFLARYPMTDEESRLIREYRFKELIERGLNPMLAMRASNAIRGRESVRDYLQSLKG